MKRMLMIGFAAGALGVLAIPTVSYAQFRGLGGGRGFGGGRSGLSIGFGNGGYGNNLYGSRYGYGNRGFGGGGYGRGYYGNGYGSGYGNGYYSSGSNYMYSDPGVVYVEPATNYSFYPSDSTGIVQTNANYGAAGTIVVYVPANAQLWWGSAATSTTGVERRFATSALSPQGEVNTFQAQWVDADGQMHNETRQVQAMPGQTVAIDFRQPAQNAQPQQAVTPNQNVPNSNIPNRPNANINPSRNTNPDDAPPEPIR